MFAPPESPPPSSPELDLAIAGIKILPSNVITPKNTKYDVHITAMYEPMARFLSPSRNLISRESFAAVTRMSEIFPPARSASAIRVIALFTSGVPTRSENCLITSLNLIPQLNWSDIFLTSSFSAPYSDLTSV